MSLAKVNTIKHVRKPGTCGKCGVAVEKGDPAVRFAVGFRGYTQTRCTKPECFPKPSERESSLVAEVYAAQEEVDYDSLSSLEDLEQARDAVVEAMRSVASQYEENEMFESNYDLQERAEQLNSAADELEGWEPADDEPVEEDWDEDEEEQSFEDAHEEWLSEARDSLQSAIDEADLP